MMLMSSEFSVFYTFSVVLIVTITAYTLRGPRSPIGSNLLLRTWIKSHESAGDLQRYASWIYLKGCTLISHQGFLTDL